MDAGAPKGTGRCKPRLNPSPRPSRIPFASLAGRVLEEPPKRGDTFALRKSFSFEGLPHAIVVAAGCDLLSDEGTEYALLMEKQGVLVRHIHQPPCRNDISR
ncbi:MAG: alpha/beta hydrolase fold domain-containing protein [bacterium]